MSTNEYSYLQIYKGACYNKKYIKKYNKAFVFDLDETLGSFSDLYTLWCGMNHLKSIKNQPIEEQQPEFNKILDLFPEFIRFGILNILDYLYMKRKKGMCDKIYIYTNNSCNPPWIKYITNYFNYKLNLKDELFDKVVCAFKINNKIIEMKRTTQDKNINDFINCTLLPRTTEICFIDNTYFNNMVNEKVYYIKPRSYCHPLSTHDIITRFTISELGVRLSNQIDTTDNLYEFMYDWFHLNNAVHGSISKQNVDIDIFVAQKIMYHVKEFFYLTQRNNKTRKKLSRMTGNKYSRKSN